MNPSYKPLDTTKTCLITGAAGFRPETSIETGLQRFADWYVEYYGVR